MFFQKLIKSWPMYFSFSIFKFNDLEESFMVTNTICILSVDSDSVLMQYTQSTILYK